MRLQEDLSVYVYAYMYMATKTISITQEAYEALLREKINKESFTDIILRVTKKSGKIADCFGAWKMTDKEEEAIQIELAEDWRLTQERISK
jgi:predicted CopG family antitoxin